MTSSENMSDLREGGRKGEEERGLRMMSDGDFDPYLLCPTSQWDMEANCSSHNALPQCSSPVQKVPGFLYFPTDWRAVKNMGHQRGSRWFSCRLNDATKWRRFEPVSNECLVKLAECFWYPWINVDVSKWINNYGKMLIFTFMDQNHDHKIKSLSNGSRT